MQRLQWRNLLGRMVRGALATVALCLVCIGLVMFYASQQAGRIELQASDALIVPGLVTPGTVPSQVQQARLDDAVRLFRLGYGRRIYVAGTGQGAEARSGAAEYLTQQNIDAAAVVIVPVGDEYARTMLEGLPGLFAVHETRTALLVADPHTILRSLKIGGDLGLVLFAAPVRANAPIGRVAELRALGEEAVKYLGYVLVGR